jgi:hypothetical protein
MDWRRPTGQRSRSGTTVSYIPSHTVDTSRSPKRRFWNTSNPDVQSVFIGYVYSVGGWFFHLVDNDHFNRCFDGLHLQSKLLRHCGEQIRRRIGIGLRLSVRR